MRSPPFVVAVVVALVAACGSRETQPVYAVRDSVGIRIVETASEAETLAPWTVPAGPRFRLGWKDEGLLIDHLSSGIILDDGRIAVADAGSDSIHIGDGSGSITAGFGGEGQGPGGFAQLAEIVHVGGDTLLAADGGDARLAIYGGAELIGHVPFLSWVGPVAFGFVGRVAEGYILSPAAFMGPDEADRGWHRWPILRLDRGLEKLDTLKTEWALYERGYREQYEDRLDPAALERRLSAREEDFSGVPPHFGRAFGDRDGRVWLTPYRFAGSASRSSTYEVVSADGHYLGRIEFPNEIRLLDIRGDVVVGVEYDEFDVQALALYELQNRSDLERDNQ